MCALGTPGQSKQSKHLVVSRSEGELKAVSIVDKPKLVQTLSKEAQRGSGRRKRTHLCESSTSFVEKFKAAKDETHCPCHVHCFSSYFYLVVQWFINARKKFLTR